MNKLKNLIQTFVIFTHRWPLFKQVYRILYRTSLKIIAGRLSKFPEVKSIYLKGSVATGKFRAGLSDIDLLVIAKVIPSESRLTFLALFWKRYLYLKIIFPCLGHTKIIFEDEIDKFILFEIFLKASDFYKDLKFLKNIYGPYEIDLAQLKAFVKEIPVELLKFILLVDDYLKLLSGLYRLTYLPHPNVYLKPLSRITKNQPLPKVFLTRQLDKNYIPGSLFEAVKTVDLSCENYLAKKTSYQQVTLGPSGYNFKPQTLDYVSATIKPFIDELFKETKNFLESIILSSEIGSNYSYRIFIVLKENIDKTSFRNLVSKIKKVYAFTENPVKKYFFMSMDKPIILTKKMLRSLPYINSHLAYFYIIKHGSVLAGQNVLAGLPKVNSISNLNLTLFISELKSILNQLVQNNMRIIDISLGILPALRLILEKNILATTPQEVLKEYCDNYAQEEETNRLKFYREKLIAPYNKIPALADNDFQKIWFFGKGCLKRISDLTL